MCLSHYHILFCLLFVDGHSAIILPHRWYMAFHILLISWCIMWDRSDLPYFHSSACMPSPPGTFPVFSPLITLTISSLVGFSSRTILTMRCSMFSSASGFKSPGTLTNLWKYSLNVAITLAIRKGFPSIR